MLSEYKILDGQSIYDVSLSTYGDSRFVYKIISDNISLFPNGIETDLTNLTILYDTEFVKPKALIVTKQNEIPSQFYYRVHDGQNLYDVALMFYGDLSGMKKIIDNNNLDGYVTTLIGGTNLLIDNVNNFLTNFVRASGAVFNTNNPTSNSIEGSAYNFGFDSSSYY